MPESTTKETFDRWLKDTAAGTGLIAAGILHRDRSCTSQSLSDDFPTQELDLAWTRLADTTQNLNLCRIQPSRTLWTFEQAQIQFVLRTDGTALGLITVAYPIPPDPEWVESLVQGFLRL